MEPLQVLVASASDYRRQWYADQLQTCGMEAGTADSGLDCIEQMRASPPDVLLLETSLLWGGSQGVLALRSEESELQHIPIVLVAVDGVSSDWYQLAQYAVQGLLLRQPTKAILAETLLAATQESWDVQKPQCESPSLLKR